MEAYSAGVLPYSMHNGRVVWLLGRETYRNVWSDFGGHSEFRDGNDPINTASREFFEETLGSIMTVKETKKRIQEKDTIIVNSKTMMGHDYTMYIIYIPYEDVFRRIFARTRSFLNYLRFMGRFVEKNDIRWFDHGKLFRTEHPIRYRLCFFNTIKNNKEIIDSILRRLTKFG